LVAVFNAANSDIAVPFANLSGQNYVQTRDPVSGIRNDSDKRQTAVDCIDGAGTRVSTIGSEGIVEFA
jgi:hypothetical protein